ncbi:MULTISPECIES: hypothetical protein [unclassified Cytobacillus]|uniref:hypothetical protein n=1 Tax=unclassified Cytobacillus TaxID=2675268 RepID=UPI001358F77C|nr:hypothetical protein [Cytobacillus sp. AMY 15.2]KAF0820022.1 hypothetical protein KIS4809_1294 [Bacillus sp. ZZV12-4809]MCM3092654.1 hypothetical protein [Cytobacillus sp. AMY 15.2]
MEAFPVIHTNFWDAVIAVPLVVLLTQLGKVLLKLPKPFIPGLASVIGLIISVFFAHRNNLWAGIFMGFFYGNAGVGLYSSLKTQILAFRKTVEGGSEN